jgi:hypothetical protein
MPDESAQKDFAFKGDAPAARGAIEKPRYTLDELLAQCGINEPLSEEDRAWIDFPSAGKELL